MVLPIAAYGDPVLREKCAGIRKDDPWISQFIADMYETMYNAGGVGLAAPQVGRAVRLFIMDSHQLKGTDEQATLIKIKKVFINPEIIEKDEEPFIFNEGCLSIPDVRADVARPSVIRIRYQDESFATHEDTFDGMNARIIQHEYDHINGVLFVDHLAFIKRRMLKSRLESISKGFVDVHYPMKFPLKKRKRV